MADVEITIRLPEELLEKAKSGGLSITDESITRLIEMELIRAEAVKGLRETMQKLEGSLTPEEIEEELARARTDRIAAQNGKL